MYIERLRFKVLKLIFLRIFQKLALGLKYLKIYVPGGKTNYFVYYLYINLYVNLNLMSTQFPQLNALFILCIVVTSIDPRFTLRYEVIENEVHKYCWINLHDSTVFITSVLEDFMITWLPKDSYQSVINSHLNNQVWNLQAVALNCNSSLISKKVSCKLFTFCFSINYLLRFYSYRNMGRKNIGCLLTTNYFLYCRIYRSVCVDTSWKKWRGIDSPAQRKVWLIYFVIQHKDLIVECDVLLFIIKLCY